MTTTPQFVQTQDTRQPRTGFVAMIDALAFKGIWRAFKFDDILQRLELISRAATDEQRMLKANYPRLAAALKYELEIRFLSDTVVVAARSHPLVWGTGRAMLIDNMTENDRQAHSHQLESIRLANEFIALKAVSGIISSVQAAALAGAKKHPELPALNYRGAISYGEYLLHDNFLVGQSVDDCASLYERSDGAFVVLHETASKFWDQCQGARDSMQSEIVRAGMVTLQDVKSYLRLCEVVSYNVPFKDERRASYALNPLARLKREEWQTASELILAQMSPVSGELPEVVDSITTKRENTRLFLEYIQANAPACFPPQPPGGDEAVRILAMR